MLFENIIHKNLNKYSNKIIVYDKYKSWSWKSICKRSQFYNDLINYNKNQNAKAIPILVGRTGDVYASFIACLQLGLCFTPIHENSSKNQIEKICKKLNINFYIDTNKKKKNLHQ